MDYYTLIKYITREYKKCYNNANYYTSYISTYLNWYKGYVEDFHKVIVDNGVRTFSRSLKHLNMGCMVSRDWASSILSEDASIIVDGNSANSTFVQGEMGNGGVLGSNNFLPTLLPNGVELTFALGTGAYVLELSGISTDPSTGRILGVSPDARVEVSFYNATQIVPLSWRNGIITECAFVSERVEMGRSYFVISVHLRESDGYVIYNSIVDSCGNNVMLNTSILASIRTGSKEPLFQIIKPCICNNADLDSPMGISIYGNAIDNLMSCDICYDSCVREIVVCAPLVMMDKRLLSTDQDGNPLAPQDVKQSYMQFFADELGGVENKELIKVVHPTLNTEDLDNELQNQLNMLSYKVGLGTRYYNFNPNTGEVTATEFVGSRSDFVKNSRKMTNLVANALKGITRGILFLGHEYLGQNVDPEAKISVTTTDGVIEDDTKSKEQDRLDVEKGLMLAYEYRMKWYGETEDVARRKIQEIQENR